MDRLALARHQRHAVFALRHQHGLAIGEIASRPARRAAMLLSIGAAASRIRKFLAVRRQQRGAAIDREIGALRIDDHALAELSRGIDDVADHPRRQHALGIVGQQHDVGARQQRQDGVDQVLFDTGRAGCAISQSARNMWVEKCSETKRTLRVVGRRGIGNQHASMPAFPRQRGLQRSAGVVLADQPDEDAARAERGDIARDIAGATDVGLAALDRDHGRRRFRRNP